MLPSVTITKNVFTTTQAPTATTGILAIIASSSAGVALQPGLYNRSDLAVSALGYGVLTDMGAYDMAVANNPVLLMKPNTTVAATYSAITVAGIGTSVPTAGASLPYDHYNVVITWVAGGTVGVAGATYTYSLDGGNTTSGITALGTANAITIPHTGVEIDLAVGTVVAGDVWTCHTERPLMNDSDLIAALTTLSQSRLPYEGILADSLMTTSTVGLVDAFLAQLEAKGVFKFVLLNTRFKLEPLPATESEAAYATAMTTLVASSTSIRQCVGTDGAHVPSQITGWNLKRPTSMLVGARAMSTPIGTDPAYVALGPLNGAQISDSNGNPFDHDEDLYPNLDGLRLMALRSFAPGGPQGTYVCNANTIQPSGGAFPYLQHIRIANRACEIAWFTLATQLSRGVRVNPTPAPNGAVYIYEPDAAIIESLVNDALIQPMKGQVSQIKFTLSRTDNMAVVPCIVTGVLSIVALAYIKGFQVQQQFTKTITVAQ